MTTEGIPRLIGAVITAALAGWILLRLDTMDAPPLLLFALVVIACPAIAVTAAPAD